MITTKPLITAEELFSLPTDGFRYELVQGDLKKMSPAGHHHGRIAAKLTISLGKVVEKNALGEVYAAETGFKIKTNPDTVRAPDVAFIKKTRVEAVGTTAGFWNGAPDLAVEVTSPSDRFYDVEEKVMSWLEAGTEMVLVVNPLQKTVTLYRSKKNITLLSGEEEIDGQEVVPGWKMKISDLFT